MDQGRTLYTTFLYPFIWLDDVFFFSILPPIRSVTVLLMYQLETLLKRVPIPLMSLWSVSALIRSQTVDVLFPRWKAPFSFWSLKLSDWHAGPPLGFPKSEDSSSVGQTLDVLIYTVMFCTVKFAQTRRLWRERDLRKASGPPRSRLS